MSFGRKWGTVEASEEVGSNGRRRWCGTVEGVETHRRNSLRSSRDRKGGIVDRRGFSASKNKSVGEEQNRAKRRWGK